eukprot:3661877-Pleurochrysis_carterae.AAC.1
MRVRARACACVRACVRLRCLKGELPRRHEYDGLDAVLVGLDPLEHWDDKRGGLSRAVLGARKNIAASERDGNGFLLDRRRPLEARLKDAHQQLALQKSRPPSLGARPLEAARGRRASPRRRLRWRSRRD